MKNLFFLFILIFISCNHSDPLESKYKSCCGIDPVEFRSDSHYIYIPNCFTPDRNNINSLFYPSVSENIDSIRSYEIYNYREAFSTSIPNTLLFSKSNFKVHDISLYSWNGKYKNGEYRGKFKYYITFKTTNGREIRVNGSACSLYCEKDGSVLKGRDGCFFPNQGNRGKLDSFLSYFENPCFR
jgi:hypothetical protein